MHSKQYIKFFYGLFVGIFVGGLFWTLLVYGQLGNPTLSSQWVYDVYKKKQTIAESIVSSPRILLIGGSSVMFGINSKMLESHFGIKTINYGVNAGLLLPYTLYAAKKILRRGDFAVVSLEYPMFNYSGDINTQIISFILSRENGFIKEITLLERI